MSLLDKDELTALMAEHPGWCISIYMSTHRAGADTKQDPIRFKNLLREAEEKLIAAGLRTVDARTLLEPAQDLEGYSPFWRHLSDGLALFLAADMFHTHRLPFHFDELVVVNERCHVKPLLPLLTGDGQFYVLALSQNGVRLLRGTRHSVDEVELEDIPGSLAETLRYDDLGRPLQFHTRTGGSGERGAIFFGHGAGGEEDKKNILRYFRQIDTGVREALKDKRAPLVLAGVDYLLPLYRQANGYRHLLNEGITGNPEELTAEELHEQAWAIVQPDFQKAQRDAADRYRQLAGGERASGDLNTIAPAAYQARVDVLFVAVGVQRWGRFDPDANHVHVRETAEPGDEDLLDFAAAHSILNGGTVYAVAPDDVPGGPALAAVFRY